MSDILLQQKTDDGILILTLNRPDAMNCFNFDLLAVLADVIREANFDLSLRCIIITGSKAGDDPKKWSFSTGADLKERRTLTQDQVRRFSREFRHGNGGQCHSAGAGCGCILPIRGASR